MPFSIIRNDITKVSADAIVNTANPEPICAGGTDQAIYEAAGREALLAERRKIGRIHPGEAAVTPAFDLPAKYIIHTVGPAWQGGDRGEYAILASCYRKSLLLARQLGCESIAFPLIATGVYGFPKDKALEIACRVTEDFLGDCEMDVTLVVFDKNAFALSSALVDEVAAFIDENYVDHRRQEEYGTSEPSYNFRRRREQYGTSEPPYDFRRQREQYGKTEASYEPRRWDAEEDWLGSLDEAREKRADRIASENLWPGNSDMEDTAELPDLSEYDVSRPPEGPEEFSDLAPSVTEFSQAAPSVAEFSQTAPSVADYTASGKESVHPDMAKPASPKTAEPSLRVSGVLGQKKSSLRKLSLRDRLVGLMAKKEDSFQERLLHLIDERGLTDAEVYKKANIDRKLFSKIRCNADYTPKKKTALALAIALRLDLDETMDLLQRAGMAFSPNSKFDLIVEYCIENHMYNIYDVNILLFEFDQPTLGSEMG